jgi:hypothetical protein
MLQRNRLYKASLGTCPYLNYLWTILQLLFKIWHKIIPGKIISPLYFVNTQLRITSKWLPRELLRWERQERYLVQRSWNINENNVPKCVQHLCQCFGWMSKNNKEPNEIYWHINFCSIKKGARQWRRVWRRISKLTRKMKFWFSLVDFGFLLCMLEV